MKHLLAAIFLSSCLGLFVATGLYMIYPENAQFKVLVEISFLMTLVNGIFFAKEMG